MGGRKVRSSLRVPFPRARGRAHTASHTNKQKQTKFLMARHCTCFSKHTMRLSLANGTQNIQTLDLERDPRPFLTWPQACAVLAPFACFGHDLRPSLRRIFARGSGTYSSDDARSDGERRSFGAVEGFVVSRDRCPFSPGPHNLGSIYVGKLGYALRCLTIDFTVVSGARFVVSASDARLSSTRMASHRSLHGGQYPSKIPVTVRCRKLSLCVEYRKSVRRDKQIDVLTPRHCTAHALPRH